MGPKFSDDVCPRGDKCCLCCPKCGFYYTHHIGTVIFNRKGEDGPNKLLTDCPDDYMLRWLPENPSSRRDGIAILFWCEGCHVVFEMTIAQHKGNTHVHCTPFPWEITDDDYAKLPL